MLPLVDEGLTRVEYRGYDSAGVAFFGRPNGNIQAIKSQGKIERLRARLADGSVFQGNIGIAHTRWATHGVPSDDNAHPHLSCREHVAVVHNGIIGNWRVLKQELTGRGHNFRSQTDTELLAHLIGECLNGDPLAALRSALALVEGTYGLAVLFREFPDRIFFARQGSPLRIGLSEGEHWVASDAQSFRRFTDQQVILENGQIGWVSAEGYAITNMDSIRVSPRVEQIEWNLSQIDKGEYPHHMLREICEQPESLATTLSGRL
ncbi:MAG: glutamine--fructose-6-phosphate aminotransferase, partial [Patescibacteria group bacterium]|nr:glutamine--fructose-6-phosphate aminotransferase [Patescibacteria group bacterium]